jgi:threonylcarbamoyladenosine tRNA methylthiotransferase MtaB
VPTCAFITLGCKVNQYDTQAIREALGRLGFSEAAPQESADLYVVNTCCVTVESDRKSLREVRRIARQRPGAVLIVTGCSADAATEAIRAIPGVSCVVGNGDKPKLAHIAAVALAEATGGRAPREPAPDLDRDTLPWPSVAAFAGHTRAFVKIEDGCNSFCSYCIVPHVRGRVRSRPPEEVVAEVERLVGNGYLEVVLTGIHLGAYGVERGGAWALVPLLERLARTPGLRRLRLSSIEVGEVSDELIRLVAGSESLCPHFHIPLQSGDDEVLRAMNRHYTAVDYLAALDAIRRRIDEPALTADVIVGFPGETDAQFRRTVDVVRQAAFGRLHVFPYSDRGGTPASRLADKVPRDVIHARRQALLEVGRELALAYHRRFAGRTVEPLVEGRRDSRTGLLCGYTERYVRVFFAGPDALQGTIVPVCVRDARVRGVVGERDEA